MDHRPELEDFEDLPATTDPLLPVDDACPRPGEHVEGCETNDEHDHGEGNEQQRDVKEPLEPEPITRKGVGAQRDKWDPSDLATALKAKERVGRLHPVVHADQLPLE